MSARDLEIQFLEACFRGELQIILELIERKAIDPTRVIEKRHQGCGGLDGTNGFTPLHYASW